MVDLSIFTRPGNCSCTFCRLCLVIDDGVQDRGHRRRDDLELTTLFVSKLGNVVYS